MIEATFRRDDAGYIVSYEIKGHAGRAENGFDIVCAAVSTLAITTENGINQLVGFTPISEVDYENGGYLYVEILADLNQEKMNMTQLLLENLLLGYQTIATQYPEFVAKATQINQNGGA